MSTAASPPASRGSRAAHVPGRVAVARRAVVDEYKLDTTTAGHRQRVSLLIQEKSRALRARPGDQARFADTPEAGLREQVAKALNHKRVAIGEQLSSSVAGA